MAPATMGQIIDNGYGGTITKTEFISAKRGRLLSGVGAVFRKWLFAMEVLGAFFTQNTYEAVVFDSALR